MNPAVSLAAYIAPFSELSAGAAKRLAKYFRLACLVLAIFLASRFVTHTPETTFSAVMICAAALLPAWLWCTNRARGLPLWPLYASTFVFAYALPLVSEHPIVSRFPSSYHFTAALSAAAHLLAGSLAWWPLARSTPSPPAHVRMLPWKGGEAGLWITYAASAMFLVLSNSDLLDINTPLMSAVRAVTLGLGSLALFVLAYRFGTGQGSITKQAIFGLILVVYVLASLTSLVMATAGTAILLTLGAYSLGAARVPWRALLVSFVFLSFFHAGKSAQRSEWWGNEDMFRPVHLDEYPGFFWEWTKSSALAMASSFDSSPGSDKEEESATILGRMSVMHLTLYTQAATPALVPHLYGLTYATIPGLLVPRILNEEKQRSHIGTYMLAVHYGLQENDATQNTTIGFGLMNEAFVNFGQIGVVLMGALLGAALGWTSRQCCSVPLVSFRFFFAIIVFGNSYNTEASAGVLVASVFQATIALGLVGLVFMETFPLRLAHLFLRQGLLDARSTPVSVPKPNEIRCEQTPRQLIS